MDVLFNGLVDAIGLLLTGDQDSWSITALTLRVSLTATALVLGVGLVSFTLVVTASLEATQRTRIRELTFTDYWVRPDGLSSFPADATRAVARGLRPGTLVSYETTLPVGTTRNRWTPMLAEGSGLTPGEDLFVVFSPERVLTGRVFADLRRYPKLVGGIDPESARRGVEFYSRVLEFDERTDLPRPNGVWDLGSAEAAELAKLAETTYRDVNIGLANQFARYADRIGVDISAVIEACNTQPYSRIHRPGIAVGGHCIPVYPRMYLWNDPEATVVRAAREANAAMPAYAVARLAEAYGPLDGADVLVLGAAYRGGVKETAFSGVFAVVQELQARGANAYVSDPLYTADELRELGLVPYQGEPVTAVVVQTDHAEYRDLRSTDFPNVRVLLDGRRVTDPERWPAVTRIVIGGGQ